MSCIEMDQRIGHADHTYKEENNKTATTLFGKRKKPVVSSFYEIEYLKNGTAKAIFKPDRSEGYCILNPKETAFIRECDGETHYKSIGTKLGFSAEETEQIHKVLSKAVITREGRYLPQFHIISVVGPKHYSKEQTDLCSKILTICFLPVMIIGFKMFMTSQMSYTDHVPVFIRVLFNILSIIVSIALHEWAHGVIAGDTIESGFWVLPLSGNVIMDDFNYSKTKRLNVLFAPVKMHLIIAGVCFMICSFSALLAELFFTPACINIFLIPTNMSFPSSDGRKMLDLILDKDELYKYAFNRRRGIQIRPMAKKKDILERVTDIIMKIIELLIKILPYVFIGILIWEISVS